MMKKVISVLLVFALLSTVLVACGGEKETSKPTESTEAQIQPQGTQPQDTQPEEQPMTLQQHKEDTIAVGEYMVAVVRNDGTVVCYEREAYNYLQIDNWSDMVGVDADHPYLMGVRSNGTVAVTELGSSGYWNYQELDWTDIVAVTSGYTVAYGLKSDGTVVSEVLFPEEHPEATESYPEGYTIDQWTDIVDISYASFDSAHALAGLKADGTVVLSGSRNYVKNRFEEAHYWRDIVDIEVTDFMIFGLKADGTVVMDGRITPFDMSDWTDIVDIAAAEGFVVGLKADGTVVYDGESSFIDNVTSWTDVVAIAAQNDTVVGIQRDGTILIAGYDNVINNDWTNVRLP